MIAGPNGSGKSTLINALRRDARFALPALYINADDLQRERRIRDPRQAQQLARDLRAQALDARRDMMYETVMSHPSKIAELQQAAKAGYAIALLLVATNDPSVNVRRVAARVAAGGHDVPEALTRARYARTLALTPAAIGYASRAFVFDNTLAGETGGGLSEQAGLVGDRLALIGRTAAPWVRRVVREVNARATELRSLARAVANRGLTPALARLDDSQTSGPIIVVNHHYALQYDETTRSAIVHDRALLGAIAERLLAQQFITLRYKQGVASEYTPQRGSSRGE